MKLPAKEKTTYCIYGTNGRSLVSDLRDEQLAIALAEVYANYYEEQGKNYFVRVRKIYKRIETESDLVFERTNLPVYV